MTIVSSTVARKLTACFTILLTLLSGTYSTLASAAMTSTAHYSEHLHGEEPTLNASKQDLLEAINKSTARKIFEEHGVSAEDIEKRINALTAQELAELNQKIDELPAGGSSFFSVAIFTLLFLIVLDLLGATDIFSAIDPINTKK